MLEFIGMAIMGFWALVVWVFLASNKKRVYRKPVVFGPGYVNRGEIDPL